MLEWFEENLPVANMSGYLKTFRIRAILGNPRSWKEKRNCSRLLLIYNGDNCTESTSFGWYIDSSVTLSSRTGN